MNSGFRALFPRCCIQADVHLDVRRIGLRVDLAVDDAGRVHLRKVSIYRDYGTKLELREGLQGGERVALSPPADIAEGQQVKVAAQPADAKAEAKK